MSLRAFLTVALLGVGVGGAWSAPARAAITPQRDQTPQTLSAAQPAETDILETRQYRIADARVAGRLSARQTVTAWQVVQGSWQGQALDGLSLVFVKTTPEDGHVPPTLNCYVSHLATPAQRTALLNAFAANLPVPADVSTWRVEAAVIKFEIVGHTVVLHLGAVA
jgi:hypothetical protein